jgi:hypothetical protein
LKTKFKWNWKQNSNVIENKIQTKFKIKIKWNLKQNSNEIENEIQTKFKRFLDEIQLKLKKSNEIKNEIQTKLKMKFKHNWK